MQWTNEWIERGRREGWAEGGRDFVMRLLRKKFGTIPMEMSEQVSKLSNSQIDEFVDAFLDFADLAEVRHWLASH
jgi:hypothetical protein